MKFDTQNTGTEFFFNEEKPEEGSITIRLSTPTATEGIEKKCVSIKPEFRKGQRYEVRKVDEKLYDEMLWDYIIVAWSNVVNEKEEVLECTKKNKVFLMNNSIEFANFVTECLENLRAAIDHNEVESLKNSNASQNGPE